MAKAKPPLDPRCRDPAIMLPVILEHLQNAVEAAKRTRSEIGIQPPECPRFYFQDALTLHAIQRNVADAADTVLAAWENVADIHNAHHRQLTLARKTLRQLQPLLDAIQAHLQKRLPAAPHTPRATLLLPRLTYPFILQNLKTLLSFTDDHDMRLAMVGGADQPFRSSLAALHHVKKGIAAQRARLDIFEAFLAKTPAARAHTKTRGTILKTMLELRNRLQKQEDLIAALTPTTFHQQIILVAKDLQAAPIRGK